MTQRSGGTAAEDNELVRESVHDAACRAAQLTRANTQAEGTCCDNSRMPEAPSRFGFACAMALMPRVLPLLQYRSLNDLVSVFDALTSPEDSYVGSVVCILLPTHTRSKGCFPCYTSVLACRSLSNADAGSFSVSRSSSLAALQAFA